jgi:hypothetical protein
MAGGESALFRTLHAPAMGCFSSGARGRQRRRMRARLAPVFVAALPPHAL